MSQSGSKSFSCPQCSQTYALRPEMAGKKVRCKCGCVMVAPGREGEAAQIAANTAPKIPATAPSAPRTAPAPARPAPARPAAANRMPAARPVAKAASAAAPSEPLASSMEEDDLYALADEMEKKGAAAPVAEYRCPACSTGLPVGSILCTQCGFDFRAGGVGAAPAPMAAPVVPAVAAGAGAAPMGRPGSAMLAYAPRRRDEEFAVDHVGGALWPEIILPALLVAGGIATLTIQHMYDGGSWASLSHALPRVGVNLIFSLLLSFVGIFLIGQAAELSFGAPGPAVLKAAACILLPPAISNIVGNWIGADSDFVRVMTGAVLMMPLTYLCFMFLFDFDFTEAVYCTVAIWLVNQWIMMLIMGALFGGAIAPGLGAGFQNAAPTPDQIAAAELTKPSTFDARTWFDQSGAYVMEGMSKKESKALVTEIVDNGAAAVHVVTHAGYGEYLIVTLTDDEAARAKFFAWEKARSEKFGYIPDEDEGLQYIYVYPYGEDEAIPLDQRVPTGPGNGGPQFQTIPSGMLDDEDYEEDYEE